MDFMRMLFLKSLLRDIVGDVEKHYKEMTGQKKREIAINAARALLRSFGVDASDDELGRIIDGIVAVYNITRRFTHKNS